MNLKVVSVSDVKTASDDRGFFTVGFRTGAFQKTVYRNFWQQFKKDANGEMTDELQWERATPEEALALLDSGETIEGRKVTHTVEEYTIGENDVNTYSTVVFPDENEITVFNQAGHPIVDKETGELIEGAKKRAPKAVISAEEEEEDDEKEAPKKPVAAKAKGGATKRA
jgi:hypothetical protein